MLGAKELATLSKWKLTRLHLNIVTRDRYVNHARGTYKSFLASTGGRLRKVAVAADLRDALLIDADFQNACASHDPFLDVKNYTTGDTFYTLATILAKFIVDREWARITI